MTLLQILGVITATSVTLLVIAVAVIAWLAKSLGVSEESSRRKNDVIKGAELAARKAAGIVDWLTKERFEFNEKAKQARSPNDWVTLANELLEVNSEHVQLPDPRNNKKPRV